MLVFCVGMYRACSTWQYGVVGSILERHRAGRRLGFLDGGPFGTDVEPGLDPSAWHVLKAHDAHERYAEAMAEGRGLGIYSSRDLRDVAFSWMHKTGRSFEEIVEAGFFDLCLRNDRFWRGRPGMLLQTYEELIADPVRGIAEIAGHLGIGLDDGEADTLSAAYSFESNKRRTTEIADRLVARGVALSSKDQDSFDARSLLHWNHLRDGRAGGWRDLATPGQLATLARVIGPWLVERGYEVDDAWAYPLDGGRDSTRPEPPPAPPRVSFARDGQDIRLDRAFGGREGTYLDIGAHHPTRGNPTFFFYQRGWRGVNVDPAPRARDEFEARRPGDFNFACALSDAEGDAPFYEFPDAEAQSTLSEEAAAARRAAGRRVVERRVPARTVAGLVDRYRIEPPDFVSIDVAGDEARVLRGVPLATWRPKAFVVAATRPGTAEPTHEEWEPTLLGHGYLYAGTDGAHRYYLRDDLADALPLLSRPVSSLDAFERSELVEERERTREQARLRDEQHARAEEQRAFLERELTHFRWEAANHAQARAQERAEALAEVARERQALQLERDARQGERDSIHRERDSRQAERDMIQSERDSVQRERDSVQRERDLFQKERDAWNAERDGRLGERESWQVERFDWQVERAALQTEADRASRRADDLAAELERTREALAREEAGGREARRALQAERDAFERDRARWVADGADRIRKATEAEAPHRPHRLIDRLGVAYAIHRRAARKSGTP